MHYQLYLIINCRSLPLPRVVAYIKLLRLRISPVTVSTVMWLHIYNKNKISEMLPRILRRGNKNVERTHKKETKKEESGPEIPYSSLTAWLCDLESLHHPSEEDIAWLSPVGRRRTSSQAFPATSTPVNLVIQPLNKMNRRKRKQNILNKDDRHIIL